MSTYTIYDQKYNPFCYYPASIYNSKVECQKYHGPKGEPYKSRLCGFLNLGAQIMCKTTLTMDELEKCIAAGNCPPGLNKRVALEELLRYKIRNNKYGIFESGPLQTWYKSNPTLVRTILKIEQWNTVLTTRGTLGPAYVKMLKTKLPI